MYEIDGLKKRGSYKPINNLMLNSKNSNLNSL